MSFDQFGFDPKLLKALHQMGFEEPTTIQKTAIPPVAEGRDLMASAKTGSGKTAAFLLPLMDRLIKKATRTTKILILEPTREMAAQIIEHMGQLGRFSALRGAAIYGGVGMTPQINAFKKRFEIIAATPGRLLDHMQYHYANLEGIETLVLDEADRMLDMGFLPDIKRILAKIPRERQTLLFSATMPYEIVSFAKDLLHNPVMIDVERQSAPAEGITHAAYPIHQELKSNLLLEILKKEEYPSVLAFTRTKHRANRLADFLEKNGVSATRIHGARSQAQRSEALKGFKKGKFRVMVATDIAARGIDINSLALVVNFDVPALPEDYIHRVGRTARVDEEGDAYTFVSPQEERELHFIEKHIGKRIFRKKIDTFDYSQKPKEKFEIPLEQRIAEIKQRKAEDRERSKAKGQKRTASKFFSKKSYNERKSNSYKELIPENEKAKRPFRKENRRIPEGFSLLSEVYKESISSKGADGKPYFTRGKTGSWEEQISSCSLEKTEKSDSRFQKQRKGKQNFNHRPFNKKKKFFNKKKSTGLLDTKSTNNL